MDSLHPPKSVQNTMQWPRVSNNIDYRDNRFVYGYVTLLLKVGEDEVMRVRETKYLGLTIDETLSSTVVVDNGRLMIERPCTSPPSSAIQLDLALFFPLAPSSARINSR